MLDREETLKKLQPIFASKKIEKSLHNAKFDQLVLAHYDIDLFGITFDTMLAANLLRKAHDRIGLKKISVSYLNEEMKEFRDVMGRTYKTFDQVPVVTAAQYAAHDALQTFKLTTVLRKKINKETKLKKIFETIELPMSQILFEMERKGMYLDPEPLKQLKTKVDRKLQTIEKKIFGALKTKKNC